MAMFMPNVIECINVHIKRAAAGEVLSYSFDGEESTMVHFSFTTAMLEGLGLTAECDSSSKTIAFASGGSLAFRPFG